MAVALCLFACDDGGGADMGPADMGTPDIGSADLGPVDLGPPDMGPSGTVQVMEGTNTSYRVPADNDVVIPVFGLQGGYHVEVGILLQGFAVGPEWTANWSIRDSTGALVSSPLTRIFTVQELMFDAGLMGQFRAGDNLVLAGGNPASLDGETVTITVMMTNGTDTFMDSVDVTLDFP